MRINAVASKILFSKLMIFVFNVLNFIFLTTSSSTTTLNFSRSAGEVYHLPTSKLSSFILKLFKLVVTLTSLLKFSLSTSAFKEIKSFERLNQFYQLL